MAIEVRAVVAFALVVSGLAFGQAPSLVRDQGFTLQVPAIKVKLEYPSELAGVEVECLGIIPVWLSQSTLSHEAVSIPGKWMPPQTRDYARQVFWAAVSSRPENYGLGKPPDLASLGSRYRLTVVTQPVQNRFEQSVPALWSYLVRVAPLDEAGRPAWTPTLLQILLLDQDGRILFGAGRNPYDWAIGRAEASSNLVTIDLFTEVTGRGPLGTGLLTRYEYSRQEGTLTPTSRLPFRENTTWYWDPTYKDPT